MAMLNQNFTIFQGDNNVLVEFAVLDDTGAPVDVSLASFRWAFGRSSRSAPLVQKSTSDSIALSDPQNGAIQITMHAADTETLSAGSFYHELVMGLGGKTETIAIGTMTLLTSALK
jgi:hypothetical protein